MPGTLALSLQAAPVTLLENPEEGAPAWLPAWAEGLWLVLGTYPFLLSLVIALVGILLAIFARAFIRYWGLKLTSRTSSEVDDKLVRLVAGVAGVVMAYLALVAAVQALPVGDTAITGGTRILVSLLVLHLTRAALKASDIGLLLLSEVQDRYAIIEERTLPLFDLMATVIVVAIAVYALFVVWNIDPTAWLASAGVVGIAVGFAARDTLANLFAGFFIIADAPYKVGDYVVLDNGERGEITKVGIRSTRLLTRDDVEIIIPNSEMANTKVVNESGGRWVKYRRGPGGGPPGAHRPGARRGVPAPPAPGPDAGVRGLEPGLRAPLLGQPPLGTGPGLPPALHGDLQVPGPGGDRDSLSPAGSLGAELSLGAGAPRAGAPFPGGRGHPEGGGHVGSRTPALPPVLGPVSHPSDDQAPYLLPIIRSRAARNSEPSYQLGKELS
jgi:MscS family membrane protein